LAEALSRTLEASEALSQAIRDVLRSAQGDGGLATELEEVTKTAQAALNRFQDRLQAVLDSVGEDDAQLANVDLQNMLQKQQQTLQMMSNISKMLYDTATAVIRKLGG
jgi:hypothetical protein